MRKTQLLTAYSPLVTQIQTAKSVLNVSYKYKIKHKTMNNGWCEFCSPAPGGWAGHSVCRARRLAGGRRPTRWTSPSSGGPGSGSASSCPAPPCSLRRCRPPPPSRPPRWTPSRCPQSRRRRPRSLSFCAAPVTTGSFAVSSPKKQTQKGQPF